MLNERKVFALKFRHIAESFKALSPDGIMQSPLVYIRTIADAGNLIVEAYRQNFLIHPRLAHIIDRLIDNPPRPIEGAQCSLVPCASNVFFEVAGNHHIPVIPRENGIEIVGPTQGGMIPEMYPGPIPGWPVDESATRELPHLAFVCTLLAEIVEYDNPAESRDKFVYDETMRGIRRSAIVDDVNNTTGWDGLTDNGVKDCAVRFAKRHNLKLPSIRKPGRPKNMK